MFSEAENRLAFEPDDLAIGIEGIGGRLVTEVVETADCGGKIFIALELSQENIGSSLCVGFGAMGTFELAVAVKAQGGREVTWFLTNENTMAVDDAYFSFGELDAEPSELITQQG